MKKGLLTVLLLIITALPSLAAPTNTSGPWGIDASGFKNLSTALASPATVGKTVVVSKPMATNNKTLPADRHIRIVRGGRIDPAAGKTFNYNGQSPEAGRYQIHGGSGTVTGLNEALPEWSGTSLTAVQSAINSLVTGGKLLLDNAVYAHSAVSISKSLTIEGHAGREYFDNSWDGGGGSVLHHTGLSGDGVTVIPPSGGNQRIKIVLKNVTLRGARTSPGGATSGRGLFVDGRQDPGTAVHLYLENFFVTEAKDEAIYLTGAVYGGAAINVGAYINGKNGIRIVGGSDPIGEMVWTQVRAFGNGTDGIGDGKAGVWSSPGGTSNTFNGLSASNNAGPGAIMQGGAYSGKSWHFESNLGTSQLYLGSTGGAGVTHAIVEGVHVSPGAGYTGKSIYVASDANNVALTGVFFGDTLGAGGKDLYVAGSNFRISNISASHTFTYEIISPDATIEDKGLGLNSMLPAFLASRGADIANVTGDNTEYSVIFDSEVTDTGNGYNPANGIFTAPLSGLYLFTYTVSGYNIDAGHTNGYVTLTTSNRTYSQSLGPAATANSLGHASWTGTYLVDMDYGDIARLDINIAGSTKTVGITGGGWTWFSGHMVK